MNSTRCAIIPLIVGWCTGLGTVLALAAGPWNIPGDQDCPTALGIAPSVETLPVGRQVMPAGELGPWDIPDGKDCPTDLGLGIAPSAETLPVGRQVMPAGELFAAGPWIIPAGHGLAPGPKVITAFEAEGVGYGILDRA